MRCFIISGGKGSRTEDSNLPKILTRIDRKLLIDLYLEELMLVPEVSHITFLLGHESSQVIDYLKTCKYGEDSYKAIDYFVEEKPLGSAGMLRRLMSEMDDEICFVALGDILPRGGILESFHIWRTKFSTTKNLTLIHPNNHPFDSDLVCLVEGDDYIRTIIAKEKRTAEDQGNLSPVGYFFLSTLDTKSWPMASEIDLVRDVIYSLTLDGAKVHTSCLLRRSSDIGTKVRLDLARKTVTQVGMSIDWVIFIDRDDTLIPDPQRFPTSDSEVHFLPGVIEFIRRMNNVGIPIVCVSNQPAIAKGDITSSEVEKQNKVLQELLSRAGVYIDKWLFCPHHPEAGFCGEVSELKVSCRCRKPNPGMLIETQNLHSIDISRSVMLGDSFRDIEIDITVGLRIHFSPSGDCNVLRSHQCTDSFEKIGELILDYAQL